MIKKIILVLFVLASYGVNAQDKKEEPKYGITFSGFIKYDAFYDTRQTSNIREGHFLLLPENISKDKKGEDINDKSSFNMLSIQSRLKGAITGPNAFGAKTSGVLEADFFGNENAAFIDANGFRLRQAFVKLNWEKMELLAGQYWHPMFVAESYPEVISFNTGVPFQPFSRNPQLRLSYKTGGLKFIATAFTQRDFAGIGPEYTLNKKTKLYETSKLASSRYLRNSGIPNLDFQVQFNPDSTNHLFGIGVDYKSVLPELYSLGNSDSSIFKTDTKLNSISLIAFAKIKLKPITIKLEAVYAQNAYDMVMVGGYAVKQIKDIATGSKEFTNLNTGSVWLDVNTNGQKLQLGLFGGFTKNLGANDSIKTTSFFARGSNLDYAYRIAPRVVFISGKLSIALEAEYTCANYGKENSNGEGMVTSDIVAVGNTRALLAFIYKF